MEWIALFVFGALIGSFLNVIATRYNPDKFILSASVIGGRSRCDGCNRQLRWFELFPFFSFIVGRGRCLRCKARLSHQYWLVELASGCIFAGIPYVTLVNQFFNYPSPLFFATAIVWVCVFELLLLMTLVDIRLHIIPDEINIVIALVGIGFSAIAYKGYGVWGSGYVHSLIGPYALLFGWQEGVLLNRLVALVSIIIFFAVLLLATKGRGIGLGDVKLGIAISFLLGWPDALFVTATGFVIGGIWGAVVLATGKKSWASTVAFGPFFALATLIVFLAGRQILSGYFGLFGIL